MIDPRHVAGIDRTFRYSPEQVAAILGCSTNLVYKLVARSSSSAGKADPRHVADIKPNYKYRTDQVAAMFNCSAALIYKLRMLGALEQSPLRASYRIPGWSVADYIAANARQSESLHFVSVGTLIRVPGWSLSEYISSNCSSL